METNVLPNSKITNLKLKETSFDDSKLKGRDKKRKIKVCISLVKNFSTVILLKYF